MPLIIETTKVATCPDTVISDAIAGPKQTGADHQTGIDFCMTGSDRWLSDSWRVGTLVESNGKHRNQQCRTHHEGKPRIPTSRDVQKGDDLYGIGHLLHR